MTQTIAPITTHPLILFFEAMAAQWQRIAAVLGRSPSTCTYLFVGWEMEAA